jgi:predicted GIY-YIG superfamily endonuclease
MLIAPLSKLKINIPGKWNFGGVYMVKCMGKGCKATYIGESGAITKRLLQHRVTNK